VAAPAFESFSIIAAFHISHLLSIRAIFTRSFLIELLLSQFAHTHGGEVSIVMMPAYCRAFSLQSLSHIHIQLGIVTNETFSISERARIPTMSHEFLENTFELANGFKNTHAHT
jgi:hypothetical protein